MSAVWFRHTELDQWPEQNNKKKLQDFKLFDKLTHFYVFFLFSFARRFLKMACLFFRSTVWDCSLLCEQCSRILFPEHFSKNLLFLSTDSSFLFLQDKISRMTSKIGTLNVFEIRINVSGSFLYTMDDAFNTFQFRNAVHQFIFRKWIIEIWIVGCHSIVHESCHRMSL